MMRRIKSTKEIEHMQEAASIGSQAHRFAMEKAFPGMGEWEIQSAVEGFFMNAKSTWSFPSIVGGDGKAGDGYWDDLQGDGEFQVGESLSSFGFHGDDEDCGLDGICPANAPATG